MCHSVENSNQSFILFTSSIFTANFISLVAFLIVASYKLPFCVVSFSIINTTFVFWADFIYKNVCHISRIFVYSKVRVKLFRLIILYSCSEIWISKVYSSLNISLVFLVYRWVNICTFCFKSLLRTILKSMIYTNVSEIDDKVSKAAVEILQRCTKLSSYWIVSILNTDNCVLFTNRH